MVLIETVEFADGVDGGGQGQAGSTSLLRHFRGAPGSATRGDLRLDKFLGRVRFVLRQRCSFARIGFSVLHGTIDLAAARLR